MTATDAANTSIVNLSQLVPFIRGRVWRKRSGQPAKGVVVTVHADGGAELARLETDERGVFEWHDTYAVLTYFLWPHARGVDHEITTWWPAAAFHEKELYLHCRARDASWGEKLGINPGECLSCGVCPECGRSYPFTLEEHAGVTYHVHHLDAPPEESEQDRSSS